MLVDHHHPSPQPTEIGNSEGLVMGNDISLAQIAARLHMLDKRGTTDALEIGALLIEAKNRLAAVEDQSFTEWLSTEFAWSHRTADRFMRARKWYESQSADTRHCVEFCPDGDSVICPFCRGRAGAGSTTNH